MSLLKINGYDDAIIGVTSCWDGDEKVDRLVYDGSHIRDLLMYEGMTHEEAMEYIDFNIEGAYMGANTPMIVWEYEDESN